MKRTKPFRYCKVRTSNVEVILATLTSGFHSLISQSVNIGIQIAYLVTITHGLLITIRTYIDILTCVL